ncbi:DUF4817 domain-containing protein [Nephila pilipes]|uniref:DUF4817 domain-containing protein n=1 Tax=Nephila pilipes TaxID=299642 RepID=A0A8X6MFZ7_NEPPI|nr:DUF4817 domain-containing protein [Nephila pilipes]
MHARVETSQRQENLFITGVSLMKMVTPVMKAFCVLEYNNSHSVITVLTFRQRYNQEPLNANNIRRWHRLFEEIGCLCKGESSEWPRVSAENAEIISRNYERSPRKSTYERSKALQMPQITV